jgi:hypothetical protein
MYQLPQLMQGTVLKRPSKMIKTPYVADVLINEDETESNKKEVLKMLKEDGGEIAIASLQLPLELQKALQTLNRGRIRFINRDMEKHTEKIYSLGVNLIQTIFVVSGVHFGTIFYFQKIETVSYVFYFVSLLTGIGLVRSILNNKPNSLE